MKYKEFEQRKHEENIFNFVLDFDWLAWKACGAKQYDSDN